ncbi:MAG: hypothetical protein FJY07_10395 [Bacteroidetes bacterium]|nr:hypothetical protein [Bacteroidota bacterium]
MKTGVKDIIKEMNKFGKNRIPFLFIINFDMTKAAVYCMPDALKNSVLFNVNGLSKTKMIIPAKFISKRSHPPIQFIKLPLKKPGVRSPWVIHILLT